MGKRGDPWSDSLELESNATQSQPEVPQTSRCTAPHQPTALVSLRRQVNKPQGILLFTLTYDGKTTAAAQRRLDTDEVLFDQGQQNNPQRRLLRSTPIRTPAADATAKLWSQCSNIILSSIEFSWPPLLDCCFDRLVHEHGTTTTHPRQRADSHDRWQPDHSILIFRQP